MRGRSNPGRWSRLCCVGRPLKIPDRDLNLRAFSRSDLPELVRMWHESKRRAFPYVAVQQAYTLEDDRGFFEGSVIERCQIWVAESGGEIIGFLALEEDLIDLMFVKPGWQRQGVATALLALAKEKSPDGLRAYSFQKNAAARSFFEKHGFEIVRAGLSPPPENEPDFEYVWNPPG